MREETPRFMATIRDAHVVASLPEGEGSFELQMRYNAFARE